MFETIQDWIFVVKIILTSIAFICGMVILFRDYKYLGNQLLGLGYITYGILGIPTIIYHIINQAWLISLAVRIFLIGEILSICSLYLGMRVFFRGSNSLRPNFLRYIYLIAFIFIIIIQADPHAVFVISEYPVHSQLDPIVGILIGLWHLLFSGFSMYYILQVRNFARDNHDNKLIKNLNYILIGFVLSIIGLIIYGIGDFGMNELNTFIFSLIEIIDIIFIWLGLRIPKKIQFQP